MSGVSAKIGRHFYGRQFSAAYQLNDSGDEQFPSSRAEWSDNCGHNDFAVFKEIGRERGRRLRPTPKIETIGTGDLEAPASAS